MSHKKVFMALVEGARANFIEGGHGEGAKRPRSGGERLASAPNTAWASGSVQPRSLVGVSE